MSDTESWGLAGSGVHGDVSAELDEPASGGRWHLQLRGSCWELRLEVSGKEDVRLLSAFITEYAGHEKLAEHRIGSFGAGVVVIVKDSEFGDRFFLRTRSGSLMAEITIQGQEAISFQRAVDSLVRDLEE